MIVITGMHNKYNINPKQEQVIVKTGIITGIKEIMISITTGNMTGISRIITIPMTVSIINIIIIITRLTHISRYVARCTANSHTSIYKLAKVVNGSRWRTDSLSYSSSIPLEPVGIISNIKTLSPLYIYICIYIYFNSVTISKVSFRHPSLPPIPRTSCPFYSLLI